MIREDKEAHTHTVLSSFKGNPKKFYSYMNNIRTVKDDVTQLTKKDRSLTADDREAAEVEVFTKEIDRKTQQSFIYNLDDHHPANICFDKETVLLKLQRPRSTTLMSAILGHHPLSAILHSPIGRPPYVCHPSPPLSVHALVHPLAPLFGLTP